MVRTEDNVLQEEGLADTLKRRGLSCSRLKKLEERQLRDAKDFRAVGFENIANNEEDSARRIRSLRKKVCLLK